MAGHLTNPSHRMSQVPRFLAVEFTEMLEV
jgi:hypothetical protein